MNNRRYPFDRVVYGLYGLTEEEVGVVGVVEGAG